MFSDLLIGKPEAYQLENLGFSLSYLANGAFDKGIVGELRENPSGKPQLALADGENGPSDERRRSVRRNDSGASLSEKNLYADSSSLSENTRI